MPETTTTTPRRAGPAGSPEWERSPAAASLLWAVVEEAAAKFRTENHNGDVIRREQSRLFDALAATLAAHTGGAADGGR